MSGGDPDGPEERSMNERGVCAAVVAALVLTAVVASPVAAATRPPKNLKLVGDHWTPWDPPEPGPDAYIIQKGDCLWDLAGKWFGDPFLWPQIWDENRYILDSHWIYPGDPLVVPGRPTVVPAEGPPPVTDAAPPPSPTLPPAQPPALVPQPEPLVPAAFASDLYCSGYLDHEEHTPGMFIAGRHIEREALGEGDIVFLSQGRNQGIQAGDEFGIQRWTRTVVQPSSGDELGTYVRRMGRLRVLLAHDDTSTALITMSCEDIREGDELVPWREIPMPMLTSLPDMDPLDPTPTGGATGEIVHVNDDLTAFGAGNVIITDLGQPSGVTPGDVLVLYRPREGGLPRLNLGQAVILTVESGSSTAKILRSTRESEIGDSVEVWR
jgi:hypothetical protein